MNEVRFSFSNTSTMYILQRYEHRKKKMQNKRNLKNQR